MSLFDLHIELAVTNQLLLRIADALDRAVPLVAPVDHTKHPLIGLSDISRMSADRAARTDSDRATMPVRASERVGFSNKTGQPATETMEPTTNPATSVTGAWDHEDPLDSLEDFDRGWQNHPGVDV